MQAREPSSSTCVPLFPFFIYLFIFYTIIYDLSTSLTSYSPLPKPKKQKIKQSIYIYIYIYIKQKLHVGKHEVLPSGTLYDILLIQASTSSKFNIYVNQLSNGKCIYFNVLIKFKKFGYIYNFTCFELIQIDLKSHGKGRNQKNFSIFYIRLTSMPNCKS